MASMFAIKVFCAASVPSNIPVIVIVLNTPNKSIKIASSLSDLGSGV
ncbi:MAG: hypothetical protein ACTSQA_00195 [Candidatus Heimdallarchaeaceae archaeon]